MHKFIYPGVLFRENVHENEGVQCYVLRAPVIPRSDEVG